MAGVEEDHIINGCTIIPERNSTQISQWRGKTICASRMKNFNYNNVISDTYVKICPRGKKQCGLIDTENNPLCIDENDSCPINYIDILPLYYKTSRMLLSWMEFPNADAEVLHSGVRHEPPHHHEQ